LARVFCVFSYDIAISRTLLESVRLGGAAEMASDAEQPAAEAAVEAGGDKKSRDARVKPLPKPDRAEFDCELAKLQAAAEKAAARLAVLDVEIKEKNASRKASSAASGDSTASTRSRLAELNAVFKARMVRRPRCRAWPRSRTSAGRAGVVSGVPPSVLSRSALQDEKAALREELTAMDAGRERAREELKSARGALRFRSADEVQQEVARLEHMLAHTTVSLNEEKRVLTQIKELIKSRDDVKAFGERSAKLAGSEEDRKDLVERIRSKDGEITAAKTEKAALQATLSAARAKDDVQHGGLTQLHEERDKVWQVVRSCRDAVRKLRDEHKAQEDVWWANEKLWRSQQRDEKQKRCASAAARPGSSESEKLPARAGTPLSHPAATR